MIYSWEEFQKVDGRCEQYTHKHWGATESGSGRLRPAFVTELGPTELGPTELGPSE